MAGGYDLVIACGVESMSRVPLGSNVLPDRSPMTPAVQKRYDVQHFNQAIGAEMIAKQWGLSRKALDEFSARSHERAANATAKGWLRDEILPGADRRHDHGGGSGHPHRHQRREAGDAQARVRGPRPDHGGQRQSDHRRRGVCLSPRARRPGSGCDRAADAWPSRRSATIRPRC